MSLNGLDAPAVQESYQTAVIEAGGWFLLKYISRDSVELLSRGKGGVHECRNAIAKYEDLSPLYGLIIYRRRKVLIKFIPEGTSRLLQARTAVHFSDVLERYSPYETLLEITTADGLNDTSLAASFPLHTASPAASQSRLHEISEDGEEGGGSGQYSMPRRPTTFQTLSSAGAIFGTQRYKAERRVDQLMGPDKQPSSPKRSSSFDRPFPSSPTTSPPPSIHITDGNGSDIERFISPYTSPLNSPLSSVAPITTLGSSAIDSIEERQEKATESRASSEPRKPQTNDVDNQSVVNEKQLPKVPPSGVLPEPPTKAPTRESSIVRQSTASKGSDKSLDSDRTEVPSLTVTGQENSYSADSRRSLQRPSTSDRASIATERPRWDVEQPYDFSYLEPKAKVKLGPRPVAASDKPNATVAAIPSNIRPVPPKKEPRPKSQNMYNTNGVSNVIPEPPPIPDIPAYNPRPLSRGSVKSLPSHKSGAGAMTPDKIRLMKAVELRKKQLRKSQGKEQAQKAAAMTTALGETSNSAIQGGIPEIPKRSEARLLAKKSSSEGKPEQPEIVRLSEDEIKSQNKADSGIEMEYERRSTERERQQRVERIQHKEETQRKLEGQTSSRNSLQDERPSEVVEAKAVESTVEKELPPASESAGPTTEGQAIVATNTTAEAKGNETDVSTSDTVPTIIMADGSRPMTSGQEKTQQDHTPPKQDWQQESQQDSTRSSSVSSSITGETDSSTANLTPAILQNPRRQNSDLARRRRGLVEPLQIDVPNSNTAATTPVTDGEHFLSDDDDFMEELQSATVQEAQPMTMSRTPTTQQHFDNIDRRPSAQSLVSAASGHSVKSVLIPNRKSSATPTADGRGSFGSDRASPPRNAILATSASTSRPTSPENELGLRRNVSSGISQRIQALGADAESSPPKQQRDYFSQNRQNSFKSASAAAVARNSAYRQTKRWSGRMASTTSIPGAIGANGSDSSPMEQPNPSWSVQHDGPSSRNSVSVSARIIRSPSVRQQPDGTSTIGDIGGTSDENADFQHSDLVINRQRASYTAPQQGPAGGTASIPTSPTYSSNARYSTENPIYPPRTTSQLYSANHSSLGNRYGTPANRETTAMPSTDELSATPTTAASTQGSGRAASPVSHFSDDAPSVKEPAVASGSRASRFFKRMSNFGGSSKRRSVAQQQQAYQSASKPSSIVDRPVASNGDAPQPIVVGDLNVQFPDNLLWKRRWVELDNTGNLVFSIPQAMDHQRGLARKFPLSHLIRPPYAPDLDRQELPHSVMLDFNDGTTLQAAAEDAVAHRQVLTALRAGYRQWAG